LLHPGIKFKKGLAILWQYVAPANSWAFGQVLSYISSVCSCLPRYYVSALFCCNDHLQKGSHINGLVQPVSNSIPTQLREERAATIKPSYILEKFEKVIIGHFRTCGNNNEQMKNKRMFPAIL